MLRFNVPVNNFSVMSGRSSKVVNKLVRCLLAQISQKKTSYWTKNNGKINAGNSLGTVLLSTSDCGSLSINASFFGVCVVVGVQDRKRYYSKTWSHLLFIVQIRVCLAYLFHKTLRLPIINVKPNAMIKNHKINETMYGNLANEHFKMSQMYRKPGYCLRKNHARL